VCVAPQTGPSTGCSRPTRQSTPCSADSVRRALPGVDRPDQQQPGPDRRRGPRRGLEANLCRCTGYQNIFFRWKAAAARRVGAGTSTPAEVRLTPLNETAPRAEFGQARKARRTRHRSPVAEGPTTIPARHAAPGRIAQPGSPRGRFSRSTCPAPDRGPGVERRTAGPTSRTSRRPPCACRSRGHGDPTPGHRQPEVAHVGRSSRCAPAARRRLVGRPRGDRDRLRRPDGGLDMEAAIVEGSPLGPTRTARPTSSKPGLSTPRTPARRQRRHSHRGDTSRTRAPHTPSRLRAVPPAAAIRPSGATQRRRAQQGSQWTMWTPPKVPKN